jgi:hypothetical protein
LGFSSSRSQKVWLLLRVLDADFEHSLFLEISSEMAQEKRRFFRADQGKFEVQKPTENFRMEILG